jgi:hypothetical protein
LNLKNSDISNFLVKETFWEPYFNPHSAWIEHVPFLNWLLINHKPNKFVELGVHFGLSYFAACETIKKSNLKTNAIAIDTWQGDSHSGEYPEIVFDEFVKNNIRYESFSNFYRGTFKNGLSKLPDASIDLLHIDGFHEYGAVSEDFYDSMGKMSDRGIIIMHDINEYQLGFGVHQFWGEICSKYKTFNFNHGHGLGIVKVGKSDIPELDFLFDIPKGSELENLIRLFFSKVGANLNLKKLKTKNNELEKHLSNLNSQVQQKENEIRILESKTQSLEIAISNLTNSVSWRLTSPLRDVKKRLFRPFKN